MVNGSVTRTYAYGLQRISQNQLVSVKWTPSFYGYDGHGNARFLANAAGAITDTYTFDAFGAQIASSGTTSNPYLYNAERFDSSLNLYHLRARYYNMLTGRFETMDPAAGQLRDPRTLHKYIYANGNPVNTADPTGRDAAEYGSLSFNAWKEQLELRLVSYQVRVGPCAAQLLEDWIILGFQPTISGLEVQQAYETCSQLITP